MHLIIYAPTPVKPSYQTVCFAQYSLNNCTDHISMVIDYQK